jgi:hypothetical protein
MNQIVRIEDSPRSFHNRPPISQEQAGLKAIPGGISLSERHGMAKCAAHRIVKNIKKGHRYKWPEIFLSLFDSCIGSLPYKEGLSGKKQRLFNSLNSSSKRACRWARSLF